MKKVDRRLKTDKKIQGLKTKIIKNLRTKNNKPFNMILLCVY